MRKQGHDTPNVSVSDWAIWLTEPDSEAGNALRASAQEVGQTLHSIDVRDVHQTDRLVDVIVREFEIPYDIRGLDAILSMLADLEWAPNPAGRLFQIDGLRGLRHSNADLFRDFVGLLPNLCDRWRSGAVPFHVLLQADAETRNAIKVVFQDRAEARQAGRWSTDFVESPVYDI